MSKKSFWKKELLKNEDKYAEQIAKFILKLEDNKINENIVNDILEFLFNMLENSYIIAKKSVNDRYGPTKDKEINKEQLKDFLYSKDGKTIVQRIKEKIIDYKKHNIKTRLLSEIILILHTENMTVYNKIIKELVKQLGYVAGSYDGVDCDCHGDIHCIDYIGLYLIDDLPDSPFHPNCDCEPDYYLLDELTPAEREELNLIEVNPNE